MMVMVQQVQYHPKLQHVLLCDDVDQTHQDHPHQELKRRHWWEVRSERSMPVSMDRNFLPLVGALSLSGTTLEIQILQIFTRERCKSHLTSYTLCTNFQTHHLHLCSLFVLSTLGVAASFIPNLYCHLAEEKNKKTLGRKFQPSTKFGLTQSPVHWCPCKSCLFWHSSCQSRCFRSAALCAVVNMAWSCFSTEPVLGWRFKHQVLVRDGASSLGTININIIILISTTYGPTTSNNKF